MLVTNLFKFLQNPSLFLIISLSLFNTSASDTVNITNNVTTLNTTTVKTPETTIIKLEAPANSTPGPLLNTTLNVKITNGTYNSTSLESETFVPQKPPLVLGQYCNKTSDCKANYTICQKEECACQDGFTASKEMLRCLKVAEKLNDGCSEDEQCTSALTKVYGPTTCLNFICSCAIGMSLVDGKCQGPKVLNTNCTSDDDCPIQRSFCHEEENGLLEDGQSTCICRDGFVPNSDNNECLPANLLLQKLSGVSAESSAGSTCSEDIQCQEVMGDQAICEVNNDGRTCSCGPGSHLVRVLCLLYKSLGDSCSIDDECISKDINSESTSSRICNQGLCKCSIGWVQVGDICKAGATQNTIAGSLLLVIITVWILDRQ